MANYARSHKVIAEIAIPIPWLALRISSAALFDNFAGSLANQISTACRGESSPRFLPRPERNDRTFGIPDDLELAGHETEKILCL